MHACQVPSSCSQLPGADPEIQALFEDALRSLRLGGATLVRLLVACSNHGPGGSVSERDRVGARARPRAAVLDFRPAGGSCLLCFCISSSTTVLAGGPIHHHRQSPGAGLGRQPRRRWPGHWWVWLLGNLACPHAGDARGSRRYCHKRQLLLPATRPRCRPLERGWSVGGPVGGSVALSSRHRRLPGRRQRVH